MFRFRYSLTAADSLKNLMSKEMPPGNGLLKRINTNVLSPNLTYLLDKKNTISADTRRYAGHSHWKNIKVTKEARDDERQRIICSFVNKIKVAVTLGGGQTNPKLNNLLKKLLEEGKSKDVPVATMNKALERLEKKTVSRGVLFSVEARSMAGASFIVESNSDKPKFFRQQVQHVMKTFGGTIVNMGVCAHLFQRKGVIYLPSMPMDAQIDDGQELNIDMATELAIEAGAEDVVEDLDDNNETIFKFVCAVKEFSNIKKYIESKGYKPYEARLEQLPSASVRLGGEDLSRSIKILDGLEALDDALAVFHNVEAASEASG